MVTVIRGEDSNESRGGSMQVRKFVGKRVSVDEVKAMAGESCFFDAGDYDDTDFAVAMIMLRNFQCQITDRYGYNAYSVNLFLDGNRISSIQRVGHIHMCGGQGMDDELRRFPHRTLEKEAGEKLSRVMAIC